MESYHCHCTCPKYKRLNDQSQYCELLTQPFAHEYVRCNNQINSTPKWDSKSLKITPNYRPSIHPPKCQNNTHPLCKSLNNHPACAFHPHNHNFAAGRLHVHFHLDKQPTEGGFTMWSCLSSQATTTSEPRFVCIWQMDQEHYFWWLQGIAATQWSSFEAGFQTVWNMFS